MTLAADPVRHRNPYMCRVCVPDSQSIADQQQPHQTLDDSQYPLDSVLVMSAASTMPGSCSTTHSRPCCSCLRGWKRFRSTTMYCSSSDSRDSGSTGTYGGHYSGKYGG